LVGVGEHFETTAAHHVDAFLARYLHDGLIRMQHFLRYLLCDLELEPFAPAANKKQTAFYYIQPFASREV
jgi:hypothetical protein